MASITSAAIGTKKYAHPGHTQIDSLMAIKIGKITPENSDSLPHAFDLAYSSLCAASRRMLESDSCSFRIASPLFIYVCLPA